MMPQPDLTFCGQTYVAFSDLCGFKYILSRDTEAAYRVLNDFYNTIYMILNLRENQHISGLAVSDCAVCWLNNSCNNENKRKLNDLVSFLQSVHRAMIKNRYLVSSTIAWGPFKYEKRIKLENMDKQLFYGKNYVAAYLANSKVDPGAIILLDEGIELPSKPEGENWVVSKKPKGWEYFWSIGSSEDIPKIIQERKESHKGKYEWLKDIYQGKYHNNPI